MSFMVSCGIQATRLMTRPCRRRFMSSTPCSLLTFRTQQARSCRLDLVVDPRVAVGALVLAGSAVVASWDSSRVSQSEAASSSSAVAVVKKSPPLRVPEADVEALVQAILKDPSINLSLVPDALERRIYKSTILLTLDAFYGIIASLEGMGVLSHELTLFQLEDTSSTTPPPTTTEYLLDQADSKLVVNDAVLEQVADRLLANPVINSKLLPDTMERQLYVNCLKVIFRVLRLLTNSFRITLCGHDIRLAMEPTNEFYETALLQASSNSYSNLSHIDIELLRTYARQSGVDDENGDDGNSWWWGWWWESNKELRTNLYASLYGLLLGIVDDILANTKIHVLSDDIALDIVPSRTKTTTSTTTKPTTMIDDGDANANDAGSLGTGSVSVTAFATASFAAGVGVGVTLMAILMGPK